jgi:hypothetical protein
MEPTVPRVIPPSSPHVAAWPPTPLPLPQYRRRRYALVGEPPSESLVGEPLHDAVTASGETCLRLSEVQLEATTAILAFVNEVGTAGFAGDPGEETIAEFVLGATIIRDAVAAWRLLTDEPDGDQADWRLNRLTDVTGEERRAASADYLNDVIASGLSSITPVLCLTSGSEERDAVLELNLHALCCLELFNHVAAANDFPRCANESCARLFVRDERARRRGMRYCSRTCARAQAQREFRRRKAASPEPAA